jgi:hypothetical protein
VASTKIEIERTFKNIRKRFDRYKDVASRTTAEIAKHEVLKAISDGKSPVRGEGNYQKYSDSYKKAIRGGRLGNKSVRPVNLKVSGKMLNSIKTRITKTGFVLWFSSSIAKYHDKEGAGKSKVIRRMLPRDGEKFRIDIQNKLMLNLRRFLYIITK